MLRSCVRAYQDEGAIIRGDQGHALWIEGGACNRAPARRYVCNESIGLECTISDNHGRAGGECQLSWGGCRGACDNDRAEYAEQATQNDSFMHAPLHE